MRLTSRLSRLLPKRLQVHIKQNLTPVGQLDYREANIPMCLNSSWEIGRLCSCAKEPETVEWLQMHAKSGTVLFDIGANIGAYSLLAHYISHGQARVYSFEPGFGSFADLCQNVLLNSASEQIVPLPVGLGRKSRILGLRYSDIASGAASHSWAGNLGVQDKSEHGGSNLATVVLALDDAISLLRLEQATLIKIDVDGAELDVLEGARATLRANGLTSVLVEVSEETENATRQVMSESGLRLRGRHERRGKAKNLVFERD